MREACVCDNQGVRFLKHRRFSGGASASGSGSLSEPLLSKELPEGVYGRIETHAGEPFNDRQQRVLNGRLDEFEGKLTSSKLAKLAKCSQDTAHREIVNLVNRGIRAKIVTSTNSLSQRTCATARSANHLIICLRCTFVVPVARHKAGMSTASASMRARSSAVNWTGVARTEWSYSS